MKRDFFTTLPSEIFIDILSRLPVRTIWLDLVETPEFAKFHLSKSVPGLAIFQDSYKIFDFEDGLDLEHHELHYSPLTGFEFPYAKVIQGSVNGLLFLCNSKLMPDGLYICNPITPDYVQLHCPQEFVYSYHQAVTYGFGVSKMTGQHKVVRISNDCMYDQRTHDLKITNFECHVYTLGTGAWKSVDLGAAFQYTCHTISAFMNGMYLSLSLTANFLDCTVTVFLRKSSTEQF